LLVTATYSGDANYADSSGTEIYLEDASCNVNPWSVSGYPFVEPGSAEGFYIGQSQGAFTVAVAHTEHTAKSVKFQGTITATSRIINVTAVKNEEGDISKLNGENTLKFKFFNHESVDSVTFYVACGSQVKFNFMINGVKAPVSDIFVGSAAANPLANPLVYNR
jgi:hypothetical protein